MQHRIFTKHAELAGRLLQEGNDDGVEVGPGGEAVRQVVQEQRIDWECQTWVSRDGAVYDRCFDPFLQSFVWTAAKCIGLEPSSGNFTTTVGRGSDLKRRLRLTRAIALAWVEPPRVGLKLQACVIPAREPTAENLVWVRTGVREFRYEGVQPEEPGQPAATDVWRPLKYQWRSLCGEVLHQIDEERDKTDPATRYHVSARGWIRSPYTDKCTKGVRCTNGRYYASIVGVGAFWVDEAVLYSFERTTPADGLVVRAVHANGVLYDSTLANLHWSTFQMTQPCHEETLVGVSRGLEDMCVASGIQKSTAWDLIVSAAAEMPFDRVTPLHKLAPEFLQTVLRPKMESGELDAAAPLTAFVAAMDQALGSTHEVWSQLELHDRYGIVKLYRTLVYRKKRALRHPT